jgi:PiT family inorganic phosphate transporter
MSLVIALGFGLVKGFHDTVNAVSTVIYTHSLPAPVAVVRSGFFNFLGVLSQAARSPSASISLLPVELLLSPNSPNRMIRAYSGL